MFPWAGICNPRNQSSCHMGNERSPDRDWVWLVVECVHGRGSDLQFALSPYAVEFIVTFCFLSHFCMGIELE